MPEKEFEEWYGRLKNAVSKYTYMEERLAFIIGWMQGTEPYMILTVEQINRIFGLRYPENE